MRRLHDAGAVTYHYVVELVVGILLHRVEGLDVVTIGQPQRFQKPDMDVPHAFQMVPREIEVRAPVHRIERLGSTPGYHNGFRILCSVREDEHLRVLLLLKLCTPANKGTYSTPPISCS